MRTMPMAPARTASKCSPATVQVQMHRIASCLLLALLHHACSLGTLLSPSRSLPRPAAQPSGEVREIEPTCVLDFYVHESCQRTGVGHKLFEVSPAA